MLKKVFSRGFCGLAFGVMIGQIILIIFSLSFSNNEFLSVLPEFRELFTYEITAVIVQIVLTGLIGIVFSIASFIFEIDKWSTLKQYSVHFLITFIFLVPIVDLLWMPNEITGITYFLSFLPSYSITWFIQYSTTKNDIRKINEIIKIKNSEKE